MKRIFGFTLVHKITARHQLLKDTITVRYDETESYNMAIYLHNLLTPIFLTFIILEMATFFLYTNLVTKSSRNMYFLILYSNNVLCFRFIPGRKLSEVIPKKRRP